MVTTSERKPANEELIALAHLTDRDRDLCRHLEEHRVLNTVQVLRAVGYENLTTARHRLLLLYSLAVVERFRPFRAVGSAPFHYTLGYVGALALAEEGMVVPSRTALRKRAVALAASQSLPHLVETNEFFTLLKLAARKSAEAELSEWWSERRCAERWGTIVRPDGFGVWREGGSRCEFFLERDRSTEDQERLMAKLAAYKILAAVEPARRWVLFQFRTKQRERQFLSRLAGYNLPVATTSDDERDGPSGQVWIRVGRTQRTTLAALGEASA